MRALRLHRRGVDGLTVDEIEAPVPRAGEALVRVHAAALTRDELDWPLDRLPAIPSYEMSGVVEAVAPDVTDVARGDAVFALTPFDRDGAAADYVAVPADLLAPKPESLDHVQSAAVPLAALSAWQGLFDHGKLQPHERVVVTGPRGGVGHFAVQLARHRDAHVVEPGERPVDLVFDTVGGDELAAANSKRVVSIAEEAPGVTYFVVEPNRAQLVELARLVDDGALRPAIDSVFPLGEARAAFERTQERGKRGKVVLRVAESAAWVAEHSIETTADPEAVWREWVDVARWPEWNGDIERIDVDGPFRAGTRITMTPAGQDPVELRIAETAAPELFVDEADLGEIVVRTTHRAERLADARTRITYRMEISGPAAETLGPELGPQISGDFPQVLAALAERAEA